MDKIKRQLTTSRINYCMKEKSMSYRELAELTNIGKSSLQRYVSNLNAKIPMENIIKIASALNVSISWLMGISDDIERREIKTVHTSDFAVILNTEIKENRTDESKLAYACGVSIDEVKKWLSGEVIPNIGIIQKISDYLHIDKSKLMGVNLLTQSKSLSYKIPVFKSNCSSKAIKHIAIDRDTANSGEFYAIEISDNYMEPKISINDIVIIKKQEDAITGDIVAVDLDGNTIIRKIRYLNDGFILLPSNPSYDPEVYTSTDVSKRNIKIIGIAVELRAKL